MIIGHFATALVPHARRVGVPLWVLLLCSNLADFLWLALTMAGIEHATPDSMWEATCANLEVAMPVSHDLLPTIVLAALVAGAVGWRYGTRRGAVACGILVLLHLACDLLCGYEHNLAGPATRAVGLNLYQRSPHVAIVLEAAFGALCVSLYRRERRVRGDALSARGLAGLYALFVGGALVWLPTATIPLGSLPGM